MEYYDVHAYLSDLEAFEKIVLHNYHYIDWYRLTGLGFDECPKQLKELHYAFGCLHVRYPLDAAQEKECRAEMERIINALKIEYDKLTNN